MEGKSIFYKIFIYFLLTLFFGLVLLFIVAVGYEIFMNPSLKIISGFIVSFIVFVVVGFVTGMIFADKIQSFLGQYELGEFILTKTPFLPLIASIEALIFFYFFNIIAAVSLFLILGVAYATPLYKVAIEESKKKK